DLDSPRLRLTHGRTESMCDKFLGQLLYLFSCLIRLTKRWLGFKARRNPVLNNDSLLGLTWYASDRRGPRPREIAFLTCSKTPLHRRIDKEHSLRTRRGPLCSRKIHQYRRSPVNNLFLPHSLRFAQWPGLLRNGLGPQVWV